MPLIVEDRQKLILAAMKAYFAQLHAIPSQCLLGSKTGSQPDRQNHPHSYVLVRQKQSLCVCVCVCVCAQNDQLYKTRIAAFHYNHHIIHSVISYSDFHHQKMASTPFTIFFWEISPPIPK